MLAARHRRQLRPAAALAAALVPIAVCGLPAVAQSPPPAAADAGQIDDLVVANRILADQGVLDGFGHVSVRHSKHAQRLLMSRSLAPALTKTSDIMEYNLDCTPIDEQGRTSFLERFIHCEIYRAR